MSRAPFVIALVSTAAVVGTLAACSGGPGEPEDIPLSSVEPAGPSGQIDPAGPSGQVQPHGSGQTSASGCPPCGTMFHCSFETDQRDGGSAGTLSLVSNADGECGEFLDTTSVVFECGGRVTVSSKETFGSALSAGSWRATAGGGIEVCVTSALASNPECVVCLPTGPVVTSDQQPGRLVDGGTTAFDSGFSFDATTVDVVGGGGG